MIFWSALSRNLQVDTVVFNTFARACAPTSGWALSIHLLSGIMRRSLSWTDTTYTASLVAVQRSHWNSCCDLLSESLRSRTALVAPLAAGIRCCCVGQAWQDAIKLLKRLKANVSFKEVDLIFPEYEVVTMTCIKANAFINARCQIDATKISFLAFLSQFMQKNIIKINIIIYIQNKFNIHI